MVHTRHRRPNLEACTLWAHSGEQICGGCCLALQVWRIMMRELFSPSPTSSSPIDPIGPCTPSFTWKHFYPLLNKAIRTSGCKSSWMLKERVALFFVCKSSYSPPTGGQHQRNPVLCLIASSKSSFVKERGGRKSTVTRPERWAHGASNLWRRSTSWP